MRVVALALALTLIAASAPAGLPVPVSPGAPDGLTRVSGRCPTFHWTAVQGAEAVNLVVYRLVETDGNSSPELALTVSLPGGAGGWTPSIDRCLEPGGRFAWSVGIVDSQGEPRWSTPYLFEVPELPTEQDLLEAMMLVRRRLGEEEPEAAPRREESTSSVVVDSKAANWPLRLDGAKRQAGAPVSDSAVLPVGELDCRAGRYEDNGDGSVTDCRSGLVWLQDGGCEVLGPNGNGTGTWQESLDAAAALASGTCGLTDGSADGDWRLPTKTEWMAMVASALRQGFGDPVITDARGTSKWTTDGDAFSGVVASAYWSGTEWIGPSDAWLINLFGGALDHVNKLSVLGIWPVRDAE